MTSLRRLRALLAILLTTVLLAACGSDGGSGSASSGGDSGSGVEESAPDGEWDNDALTKDNFGERMLAAQREAETYQMKVTQDAAGQTSTTTGEGRISGDSTEVHTTTEVDGETMESIVIDGMFYIKAPSLKTDKPWLKLDPNASSGMGKLFGDMGGNSDPQKLSEAFAGAASLKATGTVEEVDGVDTMEHRLSLPSSVLTDKLGMPKEMMSMMPKTIEYDVWIDEQDLMRKMVMNMEIMGQKSSTEITFTDYGEEVDIEAPPAEEVTTKEPAAASSMG